MSAPARGWVRQGHRWVSIAFTLTVMLANPNAPKDLDGDGVPDAPVAAPAQGGTAS